METTLFDQNVLDAVKQWLEPLPDKSLPALNIQRELFDVLIKVCCCRFSPLPDPGY
jgi:transcription factor SPN1